MAWNLRDMPEQKGRIAIVTGANSGLGYQVADALAARGARVVLACRDRTRAEAAVDAIRANMPDAHVEFRALDLADLEQVAGFAAGIAASFGHVDLLVNNAGVMALPLTRTAQGFEMQVGTNHLGHFALTGQLLPLLEKAPAARVVTVASLAHRTGRIDLDDLNWERRRYDKWQAYGQAKLANLMTAIELQRRLTRAGARTLSLAAHPGFSATNLLMAGPRMENSALGKAVMALSGAVFAQSAESGAVPIIHAALAPSLAPGSYWGPKGPFEMWGGAPAPARALPKAQDPAVAAGLWSLSERLTGVSWLD